MPGRAHVGLPAPEPAINGSLEPYQAPPELPQDEPADPDPDPPASPPPAEDPISPPPTPPPPSPPPAEDAVCANHWYNAEPSLGSAVNYSGFVTWGNYPLTLVSGSSGRVGQAISLQKLDWTYCGGVMFDITPTHNIRITNIQVRFMAPTSQTTAQVEVSFKDNPGTYRKCLAQESPRPDNSIGVNGHMRTDSTLGLSGHYEASINSNEWVSMVYHTASLEYMTGAQHSHGQLHNYLQGNTGTANWRGYDDTDYWGGANIPVGNVVGRDIPAGTTRAFYINGRTAPLQTGRPAYESAQWGLNRLQGSGQAIAHLGPRCFDNTQQHGYGPAPNYTPLPNSSIVPNRPHAETSKSLTINNTQAPVSVSIEGGHNHPYHKYNQQGNPSNHGERFLQGMRLGIPDFIFIDYEVYA